jgi:RNA polymerase sigma factor (sigma-70 family)
MEFLEQLRSGEPDAWSELFRRIHPVAYESARLRLEGRLEGDCEDVAMQTLAEILGKVLQVSSESDLKPLAAAIARNKATDLVRRHSTGKRGANRVQSYEQTTESGSDLPAGTGEELLDQLTVHELRELLIDLASEIKKEYRIVLRDHFFDGLSHDEIATKRRIAVGSVGVYIQRGLAAMRVVLGRRPGLKTEFLQLLSDGGIVKCVLPMLCAIQIGGRFFGHLVHFSLPSLTEIDETKLSDEDRLRSSRESLPGEVELNVSNYALLIEQVHIRYPAEFEAWERRKEAQLARNMAAEAACRLQEKNLARRRRLILITLACFLIALAIWFGFRILKR